MDLALDRRSRVAVHGSDPSAQQVASIMRRAGTDVVAVIESGRTSVDAILDTAGRIDAVVVCTPGELAKAWVAEWCEALVQVIVVAAGGVPLHDAMRLRYLTRSRGIWMMGPDSAGFLVPGEIGLGSIASVSTRPGRIAVLGRGGGLVAETARTLTRAGVGSSFCADVGSEPIAGRDLGDYLRLAEGDPRTKLIVMLGEWGGEAEAHAAATVAASVTKPVLALLAGRSSRLGPPCHSPAASANGSGESADAAEQVLIAAGVGLVRYPWELPGAIRERGVPNGG